MDKQRQFELYKFRLTSELNVSVPNDNQPSRFVPSREIRMVPPFNETEVDKYFQHFEKVATNCGWPRDCWALMLQSVLKGKAQHAYSALSADDCADYNAVKSAVLKAYELVPEAYRQKFRNLRKPDYQTHVEFAHEKEVFFERWCTSKEVNDDFDNLKQLVLIEEFKRCVRDDVKTYLDEKSVSTLTEAAVMADDYALTHKKKFTGQANTIGKFQKTYTGNKTSFESDSGVSSKAPSKSTNEPKSNNDSYNAQSNKPKAPRCAYCKRLGHLVGDCWSLKNKNRTDTTLPNALVSSEQGIFDETQQNVSETCNCTVPVTKDIDSVRKEFLPFVSKGFVSLNENDACPMPITILRDTGATQSLLLDNTLKFCDGSATGESILAQGIEGTYINVPLHKVFLKSNLVTGQVVVGLRPSLPVKGVSLLLGNDLAGGKVESNIHMISKPSTSDILPEVDTELYPSCAVTRAMAKKALEFDSSNIDIDNLDDVNLSETFLGHLDDSSENAPEPQDGQMSESPNKTSDFSLTNDMASLNDMDDLSKNAHKPQQGLRPHEGQESERPNKPSVLSLSRDQFIIEQEADSEIKQLISKALSEDELEQVPVGYYLNDGLLMRKWRPIDVPANED